MIRSRIRCTITTSCIIILSKIARDFKLIWFFRRIHLRWLTIIIIMCRWWVVLRKGLIIAIRILFLVSIPIDIIIVIVHIEITCWVVWMSRIRSRSLKCMCAWIIFVVVPVVGIRFRIMVKLRWELLIGCAQVIVCLGDFLECVIRTRQVQLIWMKFQRELLVLPLDFIVGWFTIHAEYIVKVFPSQKIVNVRFVCTRRGVHWNDRRRTRKTIGRIMRGRKECVEIVRLSVCLTVL